MATCKTGGYPGPRFGTGSGVRWSHYIYTLIILVILAKYVELGRNVAYNHEAWCAYMVAQRVGFTVLYHITRNTTGAQPGASISFQ